MTTFESMLTTLEKMIKMNAAPTPLDLCRVVLEIGREVERVRDSLRNGYTKLDS
jgi:hypothetical protein